MGIIGVSEAYQVVQVVQVIKVIKVDQAIKVSQVIECQEHQAVMGNQDKIDKMETPDNQGLPSPSQVTNALTLRIIIQSLLQGSEATVTTDLRSHIPSHLHHHLGLLRLSLRVTKYHAVNTILCLVVGEQTQNNAAT